MSGETKDTRISDARRFLDEWRNALRAAALSFEDCATDLHAGDASLSQIKAAIAVTVARTTLLDAVAAIDAADRQLGDVREHRFCFDPIPEAIIRFVASQDRPQSAEDICRALLGPGAAPGALEAILGSLVATNELTGTPEVRRGPGRRKIIYSTPKKG